MTKRKSKIEIKKIITKDHDGWYFRVVARNGETLCHSEVYTTKRKCKEGANALLWALVDASIGWEKFEC